MKNFCSLVILVTATIFISSLFPHTDSYIRTRVVKLVSSHGSCSGEQVRTRSGHDFVLTAAHCEVLEVGGYIVAVTEAGNRVNLKVIDIDPTSDLMLLEGLPGVKGLEIADTASRLEHVWTFTHGRGKPTYITEGVLIGLENAAAINKIIETDKDQADCDAAPLKFKTVTDPDFGIKICVLDVEEMATTASIVPGSSGGPVVDSSGDLVGVVSMGDGVFGYLVRLIDIKAFLAAH